MTIEVPVIEEDFKPGSRRLYIFFGGIMGQLGISAFEFKQSARILGESSLFLRDPKQAWYQRGLPEIGDNVHEVAKYLSKKITDSGAEEVRFVGNCMGGFAAILFCALLGRGKAIAFAPQSFISPEKITSNKDIRVPQHYASMWSNRTPDHIYDLRSWLPDNAPDVFADVYVSTLDPFDMMHIKELTGFRNINIRYFEDGGHSLVIHLRENGLLKDILAA